MKDLPRLSLLALVLAVGVASEPARAHMVIPVWNHIRSVFAAAAPTQNLILFALLLTAGVSILRRSWAGG